MNKETFEGNWNIMKGKVKEKWGKLTDDDLTRINGKKDQLVGEIQKKYGYIKSKAEQEIANWEKDLHTHEHTHEMYGQEKQTNSMGNQQKTKQKH